MQYFLSLFCENMQEYIVPLVEGVWEQNAEGNILDLWRKK
jgi:hypothetical protein